MKLPELELLRSMWGERKRRSTELVVPRITFTKHVRSLNNDHWAFAVGYGYRGALDLEYQERVKDKRRYMVWTQGPILSFKEGDWLWKRDSSSSVQIPVARSGWRAPVDRTSPEKPFLFWLNDDQDDLPIYESWPH